MRGETAAAVLGALGLVALAAGCDDIRGFEGDWEGPVSADPVLAKGFSPDDSVRLSIDAVTRDRIEATTDIRLRPGPTGIDIRAHFDPIRSASADALGEMRLPGEPLRSFLGFVLTDDCDTFGPPYFTVISLYAEKRVDLRLVRGEVRGRLGSEAYGVFSLRRE